MQLLSHLQGPVAWQIHLPESIRPSLPPIHPHPLSLSLWLLADFENVRKAGHSCHCFQTLKSTVSVISVWNIIHLITSHSLFTVPNIYFFRKRFGENEVEIEWTGKAEICRLQALVLVVDGACHARQYSYTRYNTEREPSIALVLISASAVPTARPGSAQAGGNRTRRPAPPTPTELNV